MRRAINLEELRAHLQRAQERLAAEKDAILNGGAGLETVNREEYAFAYVQAERVGLNAIQERLAELAWLPIKLDTRSEMRADNRAAMKRWVRAEDGGKPESSVFGNDFMHALTRCALLYGWEGMEFNRLLLRVANLFRDLSCLIGIVYYCNWMSENRVASVTLTSPENLTRTVAEFAALMRSPELAQQLALGAETEKTEPPEEKPLAKKRKPDLRVIEGSRQGDELGGAV